jgi:MYXO-CTERM domain-containing protein
MDRPAPLDRRRASCRFVGVGILACLAAVTVPRPVFGYCRTNTCEEDLDNPDCHDDPVTHCLAGGQWLYWSDSCISFSIHAAASPLRGISYEEASETITRAMNVWTDARCDGKPVSMAAIQFPAVACDVVEYNQYRTEGPNANVWMFRDDGWPYDDGGRTLALTAVWFNVKTGEIYDADVEINSHEASLVDGFGASLAEIATHEAGHIYGLAHSDDSGAIMYESYSNLMGIADTLTDDDEAGICEIYPPDRDAPPCDPTPRNGFGPHCGGQPPSCRAAAPGSGRGKSGAWWLGMTMLLLAVRLRRKPPAATHRV